MMEGILLFFITVFTQKNGSFLLILDKFARGFKLRPYQVFLAIYIQLASYISSQYHIYGYNIHLGWLNILPFNSWPRSAYGDLLFHFIFVLNANACLNTIFCMHYHYPQLGTSLFPALYYFIIW